MKWSPKKGGSILASWASEQELHYFKVGSDFSIQSTTYNKEQEQLSFQGYFGDKTTTFHYDPSIVWYVVCA